MTWEATIIANNFQALGRLKIKTVLQFKKSNNLEELFPGLLEYSLLLRISHPILPLLSVALKKYSPLSKKSSYLC